MRIKRNPDDMRRYKLQQWHKWFAWRPIYSPGLSAYIWLETLQRRRVVKPQGHKVWAYYDLS